MLFLFYLQFNRYLMGLLVLNTVPLQVFYAVIPNKPHRIN